MERMESYFSKEGSVKMSLIDYTGKIHRSSPWNIVSSVSSSSGEHLFKFIDEKAGSKFSPHNSTSTIHVQLGTQWYSSSGSISHIKSQPAWWEWMGEVERVLKSLNGTRHMKLKLKLENMSLIRGWVNASYNLHWDSRGHNGYMMSLCKRGYKFQQAKSKYEHLYGRRTSCHPWSYVRYYAHLLFYWDPGL